MKFKQIEYLEKFQKDLKKLLKRFPSLHEDLETLVKTQLMVFHKHQVDNQGVVLIEGISIQNPKIYKIRKFACKSLKGKGVHSGIRATYAYFPAEDRIAFIELYYKGDQENEDRERIKTFCSEKL